jgi:hypothetical protein
VKARVQHLRSKYPTTFGAAVGVFLAASAAALAFGVYSLTIGGSATGNFATSSSLGNVITVSQNGSASGPLDVGTSVTYSVNATNNDPSHAHTIVTLVPTITTKDSGGVDDSATCASHLSWTDVDGLTGKSVPAGGSLSGYTQKITADASTPSSCAGGSWSVNYAGTTN